MNAAQLSAAYEAKRAAAGKPVRVTHNGNGTYTLAPLRYMSSNPVPYTVTARELRAKLAA
jgi:antitoxin (DNA-binding transcriptional repressor) of toxin-antitoxin stability system